MQIGNYQRSGRKRIEKWQWRESGRRQKLYQLAPVGWNAGLDCERITEWWEYVQLGGHIAACAVDIDKFECNVVLQSGLLQDLIEDEFVAMVENVTIFKRWV